jgi:acetyltransferase
MFEDAMDILEDDPGVDMVMAIFVPQAITPVDEVARHILAAAERMDKPVVACMVGGESIPEAVKLLNHGGVPFYQDPNRASQALGGLWRYQQLISRPDLTPTPVAGVDAEQARALLQAAWEQSGGQENGGQLFLDAETAAQVAAAYGIRVPASELAATAEDAVAIAEKIARPVALKLIAPDVVHKADVGGIALGLQGADEVRAAFEAMVDVEAGQQAMVQEMAPEGREVILGAQRDPQFGPLLMFGLGGIYVEVFKDVAFRLAPLAEQDAQEMIAETAAGQLLAGVRGEAAGDLAATVDTLRRVGQLAHDVPCIAEMDINPLIVGAAGEGAWAVDVRIAIDSAPAG